MSGRGVTNIKTIIKARKACFTLSVIALITAVIMFVPAAAFAEGNAEGSDTAETTSEPAVEVANSPQMDTNSTTPTETSDSDNSNTEQNAPEESFAGNEAPVESKEVSEADTVADTSTGNDNDSTVQSAEVNVTSSGNDTDDNTGEHEPETAENEAFTDADDLDQSNGDASNNEPTSQETTPLPETSPAENTPDSESDETNSADPEQDDLSSDGQEGNSYIAEVTSDRVVSTDTATAFTVVFTELGAMTLGSAQITLDDDFGVDATTITTSKDWQHELFGSTINLWAETSGEYLNQGDSLTVGFTATTPATPGIYTVTTAAWTNAEGIDPDDVDSTGTGLGSTVNNPHSGHVDPTISVNDGSGSVGDPFLVETAGQLDHVRYKLASHYKQTASIDLGLAPYSTTPGWQPIGDAVAPFSGSYDGDNNTISNLRINDSALSYAGLFGYASDGSQIKNLHVVNANVTANNSVGVLVGYSRGLIANSATSGFVTGNTYVGGLAGTNYYDGSITNSHSSATVQGYSSVGGLVGQGGNISYSYATGNVTARTNPDYWSNSIGGLVGSLHGNVIASYTTGNVSGHYDVGGLVGSVNSSGTVIGRSYATGNVTGIVDQWGNSGGPLGGLVGTLWGGMIHDSYATGRVTGGTERGGLVGHNEGIILNSYAIGQVVGSGTYVGGLVGRNSDTVLNSYYDSQTTGQSDTGKGTPKTTAQMKAGFPSAAIYDRWSNELWTFSVFTAYPTLAADPNSGNYPGQVIPPSIFGGGDGSAGNPYQVATLDHLNSVRYQLDKYFVQTAVIDLTDYAWEPIGNRVYPFVGNYNGNGFAISNLSINNAGLNYAGLFGYAAQDAEISNVILSNTQVVANNFVGALAGAAGRDHGYGHFEWNPATKIWVPASYSGTVAITGSSSSGSVTGNHYVGGLVGSNYYDGSITNSHSTATVKGYGNVGGLVGSGGNITDSYATGNVSARSPWPDSWSGSIGGIVGNLLLSIKIPHL